MPADGRSPSARMPPAIASASTTPVVAAGREAAPPVKRCSSLLITWPVKPGRPLVHRQRALRLPGEELTDERILGVEHVLGGPGLDHASLPQDVDVVSDSAGAHDV